MAINPKRASNILLLAVLLLLSCTGAAYHEFRCVGGEWHATDTLRFIFCNNTDYAVRQEVAVQLRCTADYPYKELWLSVEAESGRGGRSVDTLRCDIYDDSGLSNGATVGILRQISQQAAPLDIMPYDTLCITVRHIMSDSVILGVSDVGVRLSDCGRRQSSKN